MGSEVPETRFKINKNFRYTGNTSEIFNFLEKYINCDIRYREFFFKRYWIYLGWEMAC